jgi:antitoxin component YwqK of YwqJK toxin-antitoxin module
VKKFFLFAFLSFLFSLDAQVVDFLTRELIESQRKKSGTISCKIEGDSLNYEIRDGILSGRFVTYRGKEKKSYGKLLQHRRVGTWVFRRNGAKLVFEFNSRGFVLLKKLTGLKGSWVWWGRGHVQYGFKSWLNEQFPAEVEGKAKIRYGTREGKVVEYYRGTQIPYSSSFYYRGLYRGKREVFYPNHFPALKAEFQNGAVKGLVQHFSLNGLVSSRQYNSDNKNLFIDPSEILNTEVFYLYMDTTFSDSLFYYKKASWIELLNTWFEASDLSTFADDRFEKVYYATSSKPDISGLNSTEGSFKNVRGWLVKYKSFFLAQTWQHYDVPIALQCIAEVKKDDQTYFYAGPWVYLPTLYETHPESAYLYSALQRLNFPFLSKSKGEDGVFHYEEHGWARKLWQEEKDWWNLFSFVSKAHFPDKQDGRK